MPRRNTLLNVHLIGTLLFLYVPILVLVVLSFNASGLPTAWGGFSFKWYVKLAGDQKIIRPLINTLIVGGTTAVLSTVIGTMLALGVEKMRSSSLLDGLLLTPMVIPDIVLAIALLSFFVAINMTLGLHTIVISHVVFCIAFVTAVVRARLDGFDGSLLEASTDLGAGRFTTFRRITMPLIMPGIIAGALLSFTLSFDEYMIASFTAGTSSASETLPMRIYSMLKFGIKPDINALAAVTLLVSFVLVFTAQRFNREVFGDL
ncbi:ABC transporter permease [Sinorhizobium mexicanum]|uniref:ABC transporter permease n=1 Tax=Sinorhizobium mexicanum TaxID=375549 RepID=A0A859QEJ6_9HYPH|nr:ABC transporter permease [Sinorhizobium mexicanum]MBP1881746.1 spermidine/putrescine transport system permease protein [Sinorhizobium mexicanum]QLL61504.1 ABC transporter permease [Sinorhizobium mexicanum]